MSDPHIMDAIRAQGIECPLCRRPIQIDRIGLEEDAIDAIAVHDFPLLASVTTLPPRTVWTYAARCPMSGQPVRIQPSGTPP